MLPVRGGKNTISSSHSALENAHLIPLQARNRRTNWSTRAEKAIAIDRYLSEPTNNQQVYATTQPIKMVPPFKISLARLMLRVATN